MNRYLDAVRPGALPVMCVAAILLSAIFFLSGPNHAAAQDADFTIPNFWDKHQRYNRPDVSSIGRLRFLTTTDFPPFNFIDRNKRLTGFHVDLARMICEELQIIQRCQIQAVPWDQLDAKLVEGDGDAIIAGIAINEETRALYDFSQSYIQIPARFVVRNETRLDEPLFNSLSDKNVGVVAGSAHEAFFKASFSGRRLTTFPSRDEALLGLRNKQVDAVFGDALSLAFWLTSERAEDCCRFAGGPYLSEEFFGHGLAIALPRGNRELVNGINYALREINEKGRFAELYLRYFPLSLF